ncbi:MAG: HD family phosphohydrolase [bacterium]
MRGFEKRFRTLSKILARRSQGRLRRIIIFVSTFSALLLLLAPTSSAPTGSLKEGYPSPVKIKATRDFEYVNAAATEKRIQEAVESVKPIYTVENDVTEAAINRLRKDMSVLRGSKSRLSANKNLNVADEIRSIKNNISIDLSDAIIRALLGQLDIGAIESYTGELMREIMRAGVVEDANRFLDEGVKSIVVINSRMGSEREVDVGELYSIRRSAEDVERVSRRLFPLLDRDSIFTVKILSQKYLEPNLRYNEELVERRIEEAKKNTPPVIVRVRNGRVIVRDGDIVTKEHLAMIEALRKTEAKTRIFSIIGVGAMVGAAMLIAFAYLYRYHPKMVNDKYLILISLLMVVAMGISRYSGEHLLLSKHLMPTAISAMLIAILLDVRVAMMIAVSLSIMIGIATSEGLTFGLSFILESLIVGFVGAYSARNIRHRTDIVRAGIKVMAGSIVAISATTLISNNSIDQVASNIPWAVGNGVMTIVLVTGLLPVLESTFRILTDAKLVELSDLSHPLLKRLKIEAQSTFYHTLGVANLAETAAEAVGANPILTRVGAYFHDIGKVLRPTYFVENQKGLPNPHDRLTPSMSVLILQSHVKDGIELARKHNLHQEIIDFIPQHHGTSLIKYFYYRAKEIAERTGEEVDERLYRYQGPKPQTKEAGIVMLADSVEAISRTLTDPTPMRIRNVVRRAVDDNFIEGELDECNLTLRDLHQITESFVLVLMGIFHARIEYPSGERGDRMKLQEPYERSDQEQLAESKDRLLQA